MSCPRNNFGEPTCHITSHPAHPREKFCATCNKQFVERGGFEIGDIILWILMAIGVLFLL